MGVTTTELFKECVRGPWVTTGLDVQYRIVKKAAGYTLVVFQGSSSKIDWRLNFSTWVKPYRDMPVRWRAHAGFLKGYKSCRNEIMAAIAGDEQIIVTGYSLGGAYAQCLHEDIRFNFPQAKVRTVVFGAPRVVWMSRKVHSRFDGVIRIEHARDIVTRVPFALWGFRHVGNRLRYGPKGLPLVKYHYQPVYKEMPPLDIDVISILEGQAV